MNHHRLDPYSVDNVITLRRHVNSLLTELETSPLSRRYQVEGIAHDPEFVEYRETIELMMDLLEESIFRTDEYEKKLALKRELKGFGNPGEEALYRTQADIRVGGGPSVPGAANALLTGYLGFARHDWYVTTDTAKLLFQIKKGLIAGTDFSLTALGGVLKASLRAGVFAGVIGGKLFNNVDDFIEHSWFKYEVYRLYRNPVKALQHLLHGSMREKPNHRRIGKKTNELHRRMVALNLINADTRFVYSNPESATVTPPYIQIRRRILEGQAGASAGAGAGFVNGAGAADVYGLSGGMTTYG